MPRGGKLYCWAARGHEDVSICFKRCISPVFGLCCSPRCWGSSGGFPPMAWAVAVLELEPQDTSGQQTTESVASKAVGAHAESSKRHFACVFLSVLTKNWWMLCRLPVAPDRRCVWQRRCFWDWFKQKLFSANCKNKPLNLVKQSFIAAHSSSLWFHTTTGLFRLEKTFEPNCSPSTAESSANSCPQMPHLQVF